MKKILSVIALVVVLWATPLGLGAQDTVGPDPGTVTANKEDILVDLQIGTQSAWSGKVPVTLRFGSKIAGQKIQVLWRYPSALKGSEPASKFYHYQVNQVQTVTNQVSALTAGNHILVVDVVVWGNDSNYLSTNQVTLNYDQKLLVVPQTAAYRNGVLLRYVVLAVLGLVGLGILFVIGRIIAGLIPKWLEREVNRV